MTLCGCGKKALGQSVKHETIIITNGFKIRRSEVEDATRKSWPKRVWLDFEALSGPSCSLACHAAVVIVRPHCLTVRFHAC